MSFVSYLDTLYIEYNENIRYLLNQEKHMKKLITLTLTTLFAFNAFAEAPNSFKMAVIQGSDGASDIREGNYEKGIQSIVTRDEGFEADDQLAMQMNLCVAYTNSSQFELANQSCDQAIALSKAFVETNDQALRFVSLALNNRAILKTKTQDFEGALQDLMQATEINNTSIIKGNLLTLIQKQADNIQFKSMQVTQA